VIEPCGSDGDLLVAVASAGEHNGRLVFEVDGRREPVGKVIGQRIRSLAILPPAGNHDLDRSGLAENCNGAQQNEGRHH
jgi:hypothetical protein